MRRVYNFERTCLIFILLGKNFRVLKFYSYIIQTLLRSGSPRINARFFMRKFTGLHRRRINPSNAAMSAFSLEILKIIFKQNLFRVFITIFVQTILGIFFYKRGLFKIPLIDKFIRGSLPLLWKL